MKNKQPLILIVIASSLLIAGCQNKNKNISSSSSSSEPNINIIQKDFDITLTKDNHLDGGDIFIDNMGFHFDEYSVNENPEDSFIEIGPFGALYLESYVPGIKEVYVKAKSTTEYQGEFFLGVSSTPNCIEKYTMYSMTYDFISLSPDTPYFSIHNRADYPLLIDVVEIKGTNEDEEKPFRESIKVENIEARYDENEPVKPYETFPIDESKIPENRIVKKIQPEEYTVPGTYTYGYEVYSKTKDGNQGKMLYSKTALLTIKGNKNNEHLAVFHLEDKNVIIPVANHEKVDMSKAPELGRYNWNNAYNDFNTTFNDDRHFYPSFSVIGMPVNKDGDGCAPIATTYCGLEKTFHMPEPQMDEGYKFGGWFLDQELTTPLDEETGNYFGNLNLYANCIETDQTFRIVYYHDYDGTLMSRVDYLYEDESISLPTFKEINSKLNSNQLMYAVVIGSNHLGMLRPHQEYPEIGMYDGDQLSYELVKDIAGDIHLYVSTFNLYYHGPGEFTQFFKDENGNDVLNGIRMSETHQEGDYILPGRYIQISKVSWKYDYDLYIHPARGNQFFVTDEVDGYIMDQSSYISISRYGYGNKFHKHAKPLEGILRHESVLKVGRRAFFNRYGLKGTYFPKNAREFDIESYANTFFNGYVMLPKTLTKISQRAFMGSENIKYVALPKSIKTIDKDAFSYGTYNEFTSEFENIQARDANNKITFLYEGSEAEYNRLDANTRMEIENNASKIIYNVNYNTYYGR